MKVAFLIFAALLASAPKAPGTIASAARRVLGFHAREIGWLQRVGGPDRSRLPGSGSLVRATPPEDP
jgi:hypothetical protein